MPICTVHLSESLPVTRTSTKIGNVFLTLVICHDTVAGASSQNQSHDHSAKDVLSAKPASLFKLR